MELALHSETVLSKTIAKKIAIVSSCGDDWGGSEELWALSIPHLKKTGAQITVLKDVINSKHPRFVSLQESGVQLINLDRIRSTKNRAVRFLRKSFNKIKRIYNHISASFETYLDKHRPDLVVISQGINFDGLVYAESCALRKIPYVIVCQKAVEFYWPSENDRAAMIVSLQNAEKIFFVSEHNRQLTEEQFGIRFDNAQLIHNPVRIPMKRVAYPDTEKGFRLACIGRLFIIDKGQDILLRILSQPKWRERNLRVSFIGSGVDENGLKSMARLLDVNNIEFTGQLENMQELWRNYHALVLPSRSEGLPLVVLEAMAAGRTVIATKAGGTQEIVEEGKTGFIGEATLESFEATMERAWMHRDRWEEMGVEAGKQIAQNINRQPEIDFANVLTKLLNEN